MKYSNIKQLNLIKFQRTINQVDNEIIVELKHTMKRILDLKKDIRPLESEQLQLMDKEDQMIQQLKKLQDQQNNKLNLLLNQSDSTGMVTRCQNQLSSIKEQVAQLQKEIKVLENDQKTLDQSIIQQQSQDIENLQHKLKQLIGKYQQAQQKQQIRQMNEQSFTQSFHLPQKQLFVNNPLSKNVPFIASHNQSIQKQKFDSSFTGSYQDNVVNRILQSNEKSLLQENNVKKDNNDNKTNSVVLNLNSVLSVLQDKHDLNLQSIDQTQNHQENSKLKKYFKINMENCNFKEIEILEKIKPLLLGSVIFKKFNEFSMKYHAFDPLEPNSHSMESCGYGLRQFTLHPSLTKVEVKYLNKNGFDQIIDINDIMRPVIPKVTAEILKVQKQLNNDQGFDSFLLVDFEAEDLESFQKLQKIQNCTHFPIQIVLKNGKIDLIAKELHVFHEWINGINCIIKQKNLLHSLKSKIQVLAV